MSANETETAAETAGADQKEETAQQNEQQESGGTTLADVMPTEVEQPVEEAAPIEPKIDKHGRAYATGRRKDAVARVWIKPGAGRMIVNGMELDAYFARPTLRMVVNQPLDVTERNDQFDVMCTVSGGGLSGQAGAVRHGLSHALANYEPGLRAVLKKGGFLTRDARMVERKKYGRRKARRSYQFSKR